MEPEVLIGLILFACFLIGGYFNLVVADHSGALDDDKGRPIPLDQERPKGPDDGIRRDHG